LDPGPGLDVPRQQPNDNVDPRRQGFDELANTRVELHPTPIANFGLEERGIPRVDGRLPGFDRLRADARLTEQIPDDLRVGRATEVVAVDGAGRAVDVTQSLLERPTPRAAGREQGAVDVEEDELHSSGGAAHANGDAARSRSTIGGSSVRTASTSSAVVQRPRVKASAPCASRSLSPMARSTGDGSPVSASHVVPEAAEVPARSRARTRLSPLTPRRTKPACCGSRSRRGPTSRRVEQRGPRPSISRSRSISTRAASAGPSLNANSAATPSPTAPARFSVPERSPSS